jgi:hypothetical protein
MAFILPATSITGYSTQTAATTQTQVAGTVPSAQFVTATVGNASDSFTLPQGTPGQIIFIKGGANAGDVFPPVGGKINGGTVNAKVDTAATVITAFYYLTEVDVVQMQLAA